MTAGQCIEDDTTGLQELVVSLQSYCVLLRLQSDNPL